MFYIFRKLQCLTNGHLFCYILPLPAVALAASIPIAKPVFFPWLNAMPSSLYTVNRLISQLSIFTKCVYVKWVGSRGMFSVTNSLEWIFPLFFLITVSLLNNSNFPGVNRVRLQSKYRFFNIYIYIYVISFSSKEQDLYSKHGGELRNRLVNKSSPHPLVLPFHHSSVVWVPSGNNLFNHEDVAFFHAFACLIRKNSGCFY